MNNTTTAMSIEEMRKQHKDQAERRKETELERNLSICNMRYKDGLTLQAIATRYGLTRQRVFQIINETLD